ncbi:MAG: peptidylprolyl isomerase [Candidatus Doudnabacteria bacterium]|nr:peptidylprolyl isomerase [Candidatus Doudnabacteria bacterium]
MRTLSAAALVLLIVILIWVTKSYPVAMVGNSFITVRNVNQQYDIATKLDPKTDKKTVFDQLVTNVKKQQLSGKVDLERELKFYKEGKTDEYNKFLSDYFNGDEKQFIRQVVVPNAYEGKLAIQYNSDFGLNNNAYNRANNIIDKLNAGESFEELAKTYSDDKISGQLGGDLGFVTEDQILPELAKALSPSTLGEHKKQIIVSRLGYHILYPVEAAEKDGQKVLHLKHILIATSGFSDWVNKQMDSIAVRRFGSI